MTQLANQRFTITVPDNMAKQIEQVCTDEGSNRSELLREAFRLYLSNGPAARSASAEATREQRSDPFRLFWPERGAKPYQVVDRLALESEKDRLLEQWAHMVETEPGFEDVEN
jgi:Arc/MetJ-type ribon-helix-helix transcriptional regulator